MTKNKDEHILDFDINDFVPSLFCFRSIMFSSLYLTISAISRVVAKLSTDHSVAITLFEPAARNAAARPLKGGDCGTFWPLCYRQTKSLSQH